MTAPRPRITVMVHRDGAVESRTFRMPVWLFRALVVGGAALVMALIVVGAFYAPLFRAVAAVPGLRSDVARLEAENAKVRELAAALDSAERRYGRLREMVGADIVPDPVTLAYQLPVAPVLRAQAPGQPGRFESGASVPSHWPLDVPGYVTRGQVLAGTSEEEHAGLDVAVPIGSIVRAAGGGSVQEAGLDPQYGEFVLLEHPEGYQTMYGHLSRVVVRHGQRVEPGAVLGVSGSSGRSTAPHLHFEIRQGGRSLDPLTMIHEESR